MHMQDKTNVVKILVPKHVGWRSDQVLGLFSNGQEFEPLRDALFFVTKKKDFSRHLPIYLKNKNIAAVFIFAD
jgi:hypothetical protein